MSTSSVRDRLVALLSEPVAALGLDLEDVEVTAAGKRSVIRVALDRDGGVDMDCVADATKAVSAALDASDVMGKQPYTLEVGSPGVDRPLTLTRHWRRNQGRLVNAKLRDGESVTGRILSCEEETVMLEVDGQERTLPLAEISKARVQIEFRKER